MRVGCRAGPVAAAQRCAGHLPTALWQDYDNNGVSALAAFRGGGTLGPSALEPPMRPAFVSTAALFLVSLTPSCDRSPPTDPHRPLALRLEADRVLDVKNFVAHLTGANEVPSSATRYDGEMMQQWRMVRTED